MAKFRIRKITPREAFRLMGVREHHIDLLLNAGVSNTRLYKMAGNSIVVDVLYYIFRELFITEHTPLVETNPLRVCTTFSGYDSQCMGLDLLKDHYPEFSYDLVAWSEIDPYVIQAHDAVYPQWADRNLGDVTQIDWTTTPDFDLFTYSFPCQSISVCGSQEGFKEGSGTKSSLLWECTRAIEEKHPRLMLMENVKALVSKKFMPDFQQWQEYLEAQGYTNFWQVLNAKDYGVPQHRARVFMVSILDENAHYSFPKPFPLERRWKDMLEQEIPEKYFLSEKRVEALDITNIPGFND